MRKEVNPKDTTRERQFDLWKNAPNPMLMFVKKLDVTKLVKLSKRKGHMSRIGNTIKYGFL